MNLLVVDTSSENVSLCIMHNGKIVADFNRCIKFGASKLIIYIERYIKKSSLNLKDFDAFVIGSGPGSFTGLRISFSLIKGFMTALNKPAISICSFFSCAYLFRDKYNKIAVISDARKGLIYLSCFKAGKGILNQENKCELIALEELKKRQDYLFITHDMHLRKKVLECYPDINFYSKSVYPKAKYLLPLARKKYVRGKFIPIEKLQPLYLHAKTCQIRK